MSNNVFILERKLLCFCKAETQLSLSLFFLLYSFFLLNFSLLQLKFRPNIPVSIYLEKRVIMLNRETRIVNGRYFSCIRKCWLPFSYMIGVTVSSRTYLLHLLSKRNHRISVRFPAVAATGGRWTSVRCCFLSFFRRSVPLSFVVPVSLRLEGVVCLDLRSGRPKYRSGFAMAVVA